MDQIWNKRALGAGYLGEKNKHSGWPIREHILKRQDHNRVTDIEVYLVTKMRASVGSKFLPKYASSKGLKFDPGHQMVAICWMNVKYRELSWNSCTSRHPCKEFDWIQYKWIFWCLIKIQNMNHFIMILLVKGSVISIFLCVHNTEEFEPNPCTPCCDRHQIHRANNPKYQRNTGRFLYYTFFLTIWFRNWSRV